MGQLSPWGTNVPFNFVPRTSPEHQDPGSDATRVQLSCTDLDTSPQLSSVPPELYSEGI